MKNFYLLGLVPLALAVPATVQKRYGGAPGAALYFMLNDPSGNSIVTAALDTSSNTLSNAQTVSTGGNGAYGVDQNNDPESTDTLYSAGSVVVGGNEYVLSVNAGSNTLSLFGISSNNPQDLTLIGNPINTLGNFPNSVTYSPQNKLACVTNTGATNGIACFNVDPVNGLSHNTSLMAADQFTQSSPPSGPQNTYSKIEWNPTQQYILATIKGNPNTDTAGTIVAILLDSNTGKFNAPVYSETGYIALPFGFEFISDLQIWVADPGYGGLIYNINYALQASVSTVSAYSGDKLTCWAAYSSSLQELYLLDASQSTIFVGNMSGSEIGSFSNGSPYGVGSFDVAIINDWMYILLGETGIMPVDLASQQPGTYFNTYPVAPYRQTYEGLAVYPNQVAYQ